MTSRVPVVYKYKDDVLDFDNRDDAITQVIAFSELVWHGQRAPYTYVCLKYVAPAHMVDNEPSVAPVRSVWGEGFCKCNPNADQFDPDFGYITALRRAAVEIVLQLVGAVPPRLTGVTFKPCHSEFPG